MLRFLEKQRVVSCWFGRVEDEGFGNVDIGNLYTPFPRSPVTLEVYLGC